MPSVYRFAASLGEMAYFDTHPGAGSGTPLLLVHGLPTAKELWLPVMQQLPGHVRCIVPDLHDYGESARVGRPISHVERAVALDELRGYLGLERIHLVAHDLGASVAVDYMARYAPYVQRLVLMSPPVYPDFEEPKLVRLVRRRLIGEFLVRFFLERLLRRRVKDGLTHPDHYSDAMHRSLMQAFSDKEGRAALLRNLRWGSPHDLFLEYPAILRKLSTPTLVLQGSLDPYIHFSQAERLANHLENGELLYIEEGSHFLPLDTPQQIAQALRVFLSL